MTSRRLASVLAVALVGLAACDTNDGRALRPPTSEQRAAMPTTTVSSTSTTGARNLGETVGLPTTTAAAATTTFALTAPWGEGGVIPADYGCDGAGLNPVVTWTAPPSGTVELALVVSDPDAAEFVHYAVIGLAPGPGQVGGDVAPAGALEGVNDFGAPGWGGPCPPAGETHHYRWTLYALGQQAELPDDFTGAELIATVAHVALATTSVTGTYTRAG